MEGKLYERGFAAASRLALLAGLAGLALTMPPHPAEAALVDSYCAPSGAYCTAVRESKDGRVKLRITTVGKRFERFRLCVEAGGGRACRGFKMKRNGPLWTRTVAWKRNFPDGGPGMHFATWHRRGRQLGDALRFKP